MRITRDLFVIVAVALVGTLLLWPEDEDGRATRAVRAPEREPRSTTNTRTTSRRDRAGAPAKPDRKPAPKVRTTRPGPYLEVWVRDETDAYRSGVPVSLRKTTPSGPVVIAQKDTDAEGYVRFEDPDVGRVAIYIDPGGRFDPYFAKHWNSDDGHLAVRLRLYQPRELTLHVTVDGKTGFPDEMELRTPKLYYEQRDAVRGIVRGQFIPQSVPGDSQSISVRAPHCHKSGAGVTLGEPGMPLVARVDVRMGVEVEIKVLGRPEGVKSISVARFLGSSRVAFVSTRNGWRFAEGKTELSRSLLLSPGPYRLEFSGQGLGHPIHEFEIPTGVRNHAVTLDLRGAQWIDFETILPDDYEPPAPLFIVVEGATAHPIRVPPDRRLLLASGKEVKLTLQAPLLRPHPIRGSVLASTGGTITLEAIRAPLLSYEWRPALEIKRTLDRTRWVYASGAFHYSSFQVTLLPRDGASPKPLHFAAWPNGKRHECGPLPTGTFDIWLRHPSLGAPLQIRNVRIGEEDLDLGRLTPLPGSSVIIQLRNSPPNARLYASATVGDPPHHIGASFGSNQGSRVIVKRLPPGTIDLSITGGKRKWKRTVECDGHNTQTIEIDCEER